ncbi:hypothetical protein JNUCC1_00808 [Lentibacillus sp. JNUCC-1]|uniref:hypothetical protein n=1 Tax=Lentibacillus sp. JNUCC-1 TaxID=2654513 RepID=UPI0012E971E0|nr:hypothetical protein [Lentibacillus sp. JNUCC-1]MUV37002.1 hypothetical protein [Lentibacillus sp. JNUCC-1]
MNMLFVREDIDQLVTKNYAHHNTRKSFREAMLKDLAQLAAKYGLTGMQRYRDDTSGTGIDVGWQDQEGHLVLAIEIDNSLRSRSVEKLASLPDHVERVWLCYSPKEIDVQAYEDNVNGVVMKYELGFGRREG